MWKVGVKVKSIIQNDKKCYITGDTDNLHEHHVFNASNRNKSEKYGLKVWLRSDWHNGTKKGVHNDKEFERQLKAEIQKKAMEYYGWSVEDFIRIFGKNYT